MLSSLVSQEYASSFAENIIKLILIKSAKFILKPSLILDSLSCFSFHSI